MDLCYTIRKSTLAWSAIILASKKSKEKVAYNNKKTNINKNGHSEGEIRKQSGFVFPIRIP